MNNNYNENSQLFQTYLEDNMDHHGSDGLLHNLIK